MIKKEYKEFFLEIKRIKNKIAKALNKTKTVRFISHLDADGLCSAGLFSKVLLKYNKKFHLTIIKQLEKEIVDGLEKEDYETFLFTDIGSGQLNEVKRLLKKGTVIILDHHPPSEKIDSENLIMLNPHDFDIDGGQEICAATLTYFLAKEFGINDIEHLAITGSIGDRQEKDGSLNGVNKIILDNINETVQVRKGLKAFGRVSKPIHKALTYSTETIPDVSGNESSAIQFLSELGIELKKEGAWRTLNDLTEHEEKKLITGMIMKRLNKTENPGNIVSNIYNFKNQPGILSDAHEFATVLNSCGRQNAQSVGIMLCLGEKEESLKLADKIISSYKRKLLKALKWVEENIKDTSKVYKTDKTQYIIGKDQINDTLIGTICSILAGSEKTKKDILIGFADSENGVKVSGRLTPKTDFDLGDVIGKVVKELGGEGGGHGRAGGAKIQKGQEKQFIDKFEQTIKDIKG